MKKLTALALAVTASVSLSAKAGIVTNDTELLSAAGHQQFSEWLGRDVDLTRIFAKQQGDDSYGWHNVVENKGATLTLVEIFNGSERMVIGGYTTLNWAGSGYTHSSDGQSNFLMNFSRSNIYRKRSTGSYEARAIFLGDDRIAFGGGHDLYINSDLSGGYTNIGYSYGGASRYGDTDYREEFTGTYNNWTVGALETFTLSDSTGSFGSGATASIDEQGNAVAATNVNAPLGFATLGLAGLFFGRRRKLKAGRNS